MKQKKEGVLVAPVAKLKASTKAEKRKAAKDRIKTAYAEEAKVEVIPAMVDLIRAVMPSWEKGVKYRAKGILSKEDKAIVFDLKSAEVYQRFNRKETD